MKNKMGNVNSSKIQNVISVVNSVSNEIVNRSITEGNTTGINIQTLRVIFGVTSDIKGCNFVSGQTINSNQQVNVSNTFNSSSDVKNSLNNMLDQLASSTQSAVADFLSTAVNANVSEQSLVSSIRNDIDTKITNESITRCKNTISNLQDGTFEFLGKYTCPPGGSLTINQDIINDQISQCMSKTFFDVIATNDLVNQVVQKAESEQAAETKGPLSFLSNPIFIVGIILGLIVLIGIVYLIYKFYVKTNPITAFSSN
jgi:hypothetical protein